MDAMHKMTGFIDEIAGLAGARDRDALEYTMASVMFQLTGARLLSTWSVAPRDGDIGVRCCVTLGSARCEHCEVGGKQPHDRHANSDEPSKQIAQAGAA